ADFSVFVDDLWVKGEDHVLFQWHVAFGADRRMFDHGRTDAVSGEMAERKSVLRERVGDTAVHIAGQFSRTHEFSGGLQCVRISLRHGLRAGTQLSANQRPGELDPVAACAGDLERVQQKVVACDHPISRHFERRFGFAVAAREQDVHHARPRATGEEALDRGGHDLGFGFAGLVGGDERPEAVKDDVHGVAYFDEFFFTLYGAGHVELNVERFELEWALAELAVVADSHDEIQAIDPYAFPAALVP